MSRVLRASSSWDARALRAALDARGLTALYQPVVDLRSGHVVAVEALARLRDPGTGHLRAPSEFIALAEQSGQVSRIDREMLVQAALMAVRVRAVMPGRPFSCAVNLSVASLALDLPAYVREVCARAGLPSNALILEVTETTLSEPGRRHGQVLQELHDFGCNVTMDDFGTGFSSLSHLVRFPVDGLKIDRVFVDLLGRDERGAGVAAALVALGASLGAHVVAEGIETPDQLRALRTAGCPFGQGYLFARPLTATALMDMLTKQTTLVPPPRLGES